MHFDLYIICGFYSSYEGLLFSKMCETVLAYPRIIGYTLRDGNSLWVSATSVIHAGPLPDVSKGNGKCLQRTSLGGKKFLQMIY